MGTRPWDAEHGGGHNLQLAGAIFNRRPSTAPVAAGTALSAPRRREQPSLQNHTHAQERPSPGGVYSDRLSRDRLRAVSELPRCFQPVFREFSFFNSVQSEMLDFILSTSRSFVVSASWNPPPSPSSKVSIKR